MQLTTAHDSIPSSLRIPITSADGLTVSVPLHGSLDPAIVDCDDFKKLQDIGLTDQWRLEKVRGYLSAKQEQAIYAVRRIAGGPPKEVLDGERIALAKLAEEVS